MRFEKAYYFGSPEDIGNVVGMLLQGGDVVGVYVMRTTRKDDESRICWKVEVVLEGAEDEENSSEQLGTSTRHLREHHGR